MRIFTLLLGLLFTLPSLANWQLSNEKSQFNFVTTKKGSGTEVHQFTQLKGDVSAKGEVNLIVDLTSVETNISIRNERMQKFLFETDLFPQAIFTTSVEQHDIETLQVGEIVQIDLAGEISLHGLTQKINTQVQVIKLQDNALLVSSLKPVIIQAKAFNLETGIEKLKTLAALPSINHSVLVTFSLHFTK
jgi:polyisoprenoid-binding protein YceI